MAASEQLSHVRPTLEQVDRFGYAVAETAYSRWCAGLSAPLWREAFDAPSVLKVLSEANVPDVPAVKAALMRRAGGRGWLVYVDEPRSLRFGPTYLSSTRTRVHVRDPHKIGRYVAYAARGFHRRYNRHPTTADLAFYMRTADGSTYFRSEAELIKNLPWLCLAGFTSLRDGAIHRGEQVAPMVVPPPRRPSPCQAGDQSVSGDDDGASPTGSTAPRLD